MAENITDLERLDRIKNGLHCSDSEAADILAYDKAIDEGFIMEHDLEPEKEKIAKQYAYTGMRKTTDKPIKPKRKPNDTKGVIIAALAACLEQTSALHAQNVTVEKPERLITFAVDGKNFDLTLTQKRDKKVNG